MYMGFVPETHLFVLETKTKLLLQSKVNNLLFVIASLMCSMFVFHKKGNLSLKVACLIEIIFLRIYYNCHY